jgi:ankyrin repeat protein
MMACLQGKANAVRALLEAGADVKIGEGQGYTCAHGVGFQGRAKLVPILAAAGLDLSDRHADGFTPIHRACWGTSKRHTATVRALLKAGVDPQERASDGKTPLELSPNEGTRKLLLEAVKAKTIEDFAAEAAEAAAKLEL